MVLQSRPTTFFRLICRPALCRATQRGRAANQVLTKLFNEVERTIKSPSSNLARKSKWPNLCRATLLGVAYDQFIAEQPYEAKRPTKSSPSHLARQKDRSSTANPRQNDKTCHHQNTSGPKVRHTEGAPKSRCQHNGTPTWWSLVYSVCLVGQVNPNRGDLAIGVSIVIHVPERMGRYTTPGVCLHT